MEFSKGGVKRPKAALKRRRDNRGLNGKRRGCRGLREREREREREWSVCSRELCSTPGRRRMYSAEVTVSTRVGGAWKEYNNVLEISSIVCRRREKQGVGSHRHMHGEQ